MIRRPPRSTQSRSSAASDVYKRQNHNEGAWTAGSEDLRQIEDQRLVVFRYCDEGGDVTDAVNPNGAVDNVAGIVNERGNVLGMMPHPERVCESAVGGIGGRGLFDSLINHGLEGM